MGQDPALPVWQHVAPLAGSVDRNLILTCRAPPGISVAPLAGSVDRNFLFAPGLTALGLVAPLAGSVDRNSSFRVLLLGFFVAPLAGSVDRNQQDPGVKVFVARRSPRGERG